MKKVGKRSVREARNGYLLILPLIAGCLVFYAVPFISVIIFSFVRGSGISMRFVGLENYQKMMDNRTFVLAFGNTVRFLLTALPLILVISYAIALLLKSSASKYQLLKGVILLPYIMPVAGTVLIVDLIFAESGMANRLLEILGIPLADWLGSGHAFVVAVLLYLWKNTGYSVILLLSGLVTISEDCYRAARIDGAGALQCFLYITVPQMWYSVFFAGVFSLINAFKCFREIFLIGGTHPDDSIYMLQHFINNCFKNLNYQKLAVASVLLMIMVTAVFALCYCLVMKKEAYRS